MITLIFIIAMLLCVFCLLAVIACCQQAGRANRIFDEYFDQKLNNR